MASNNEGPENHPNGFRIGKVFHFGVTLNSPELQQGERLKEFTIATPFSKIEKGMYSVAASLAHINVTVPSPARWSIKVTKVASEGANLLVTCQANVDGGNADIPAVTLTGAVYGEKNPKK